MYLILEIERPHNVKIDFVKTYKEVKSYLLDIDKSISIPNDKFKDFHVILTKASKATDIYISTINKKETEILLNKLK